MPSADPVTSSARCIRVLFVDDQREVAKTLSKLVLGDNIQWQFADDGEDGLARIAKEVFDLVVIDLQMPPGRWGGLWLLRELSDRGLLVDTLVLSGQAGQSETIEAMRLGARDFVVKDNASSELADRVREALVQGAEDRSIYAAAQLPTPIALPYQRMGASKDPDAQLRAGLTTAEAVLRFCALAAVAVVRANSTLDESLLTRLALPSLGSWLDVCRMLSPLVANHEVHRWIQAACGKDTDRLVRHRNDTVHGGGIPSVGMEDALADVRSWLDFFILATRSEGPIEMVVAGPMTFTGTSYRVELAKLAGAARSVAWARTNLSAPLVTGRVYMRSSTDGYVDIWPLVLADHGASMGDWNVAMMDGYRQTRRGEIKRSDRLRYVDASTGTRFTSPSNVLGDVSL
jgi:DNA-binding response OmpR family regulator